MIEFLQIYTVLGILWFIWATGFFRENVLAMLFILPLWLPFTIKIFIDEWKTEQAIKRYYRQLREREK